MSLSWVDNFSQYPLGQLPSGVWSGPSLPTVATVGRNGGKGLAWNRNAMSRPASLNYNVQRIDSGPFGPVMGVVGAYRVDSGGRVLIANMSEVGQPANTLTTAHWLMGGMNANGFAYAGLVVTEDGALHVIRGSAFDWTPNSPDVVVLASTPSGVIPIQRGWFLLEAAFQFGYPGTVKVWVNGDLVIDIAAITLPLGDYCLYNEFRDSNNLPYACPGGSNTNWYGEAPTMQLVVGGASRGGRRLGGNAGWSGSIGFLAGFNRGDTIGPMIGDIAVADLLPNGDGAVSQSSITGTTPAPTRWQSVDDALTPDGDATTVTFTGPSAPDEDEYLLSEFPYPSAAIYGAQVSSSYRVLSPGYSSTQLGLSDGTNVAYGPALFSRERNFTFQASPSPERPAGGAWAVGDLANLRVRVKREV